MASINSIPAICPELGILIASKGRPDILGETLVSISRQTILPGEVILSVVTNHDVPNILPEIPNIRIVIGSKGATRQLNRGVLEFSINTNLIVVIDDDVELHKQYLESIAHIFSVHSHILIFNGNCLYNRVHDRHTARVVLDHAITPTEAMPVSINHVWGCNICVRKEVLYKICFDERLPLYGWLWDVEWGERCKQAGYKIWKVATPMFCHLQVEQGRIPGVGYGFSQIMNPTYFFRKGVIVSGWYDLLVRNYVKCFLINLYGLIRGDKQIDRLGRLRGNMIALGYVLIGRVEPELLERVVSKANVR